MLFLAPGKVKVCYYHGFEEISQLANDPNFPDHPYHVGRIDNFDSAIDIGDHYKIRMQTYFVAPATGSYTFIAATDDESFVYLSTSRLESQKERIISVTHAIAKYDYSG